MVMAEEKSALEFVAVPMALREVLADAPMEKVGMALMLALYCGLQCNGGVIAGARLWSSRQTLIRVGLSRVPDEDEPGLWEWRGDDLHVLLYSVEYEKRTIARRKAGRAAIETRWRNSQRIGNECVNTNVDTNVNTNVLPTNYDGNTNVDTMVIQGKDKVKNKNKGCVCSTVDSEAQAKQARAPLVEVDEGYVAWMGAFCEHLPALRRLRTLPHDVAVASREAYRACPEAAQYAEMVGRYYAAAPDSVKTYRPTALRFMFEALHDIVEHACSWCAVDDRRQRKLAATERARAQERANAVQDVENAISAEDAAEEFAAMRKELRP